MQTAFPLLTACALVAGFAAAPPVAAQAPVSNLVTYAGNAGRETFSDVLQLSDGSYLVAGAADDLNWIASSVPRTVLPATGINNAQGTGQKIGFVLHLSANLQTVQRVVHFPAGAVQGIAQLRTTSAPGQTTGQLYLSASTLDTRAREGGYCIVKLNGNFVAVAPTGVEWVKNVWAEGYGVTYQPWDVGADGRVVYISGQSHGADWCAAYALTPGGQPRVVPEWRTHWLTNGNEYRGFAASAPGGTAAVAYSAIVFKKTGRCDLRSWTAADYTLNQPDGNGRTRQGKWPVDAFFGGPCDPAAPTASGSGYTGYSTGGAATYGVSAVAIDRRTNECYIGFNVQTRLPDGNPDFEPAVLATTETGNLKWWSRLYHERNAAGQPVNSTPDQYIDGLAVDYSQAAASSNLVVLARCHGNNVENLWRGNQIAATANASGFQNQFTGTNGNIHISWLGKLALDNGTLRHSTYVAEYVDDMAGTGAAHPDPNLDGWPNPNAGWANVNTTRVNDVEVGPDGAVGIVGVGRRVITTAGAHQKMLKRPASSAWSQFVRVYTSDLGNVRYSSLLSGTWDPATGAGGGNTTLEALSMASGAVVAVGRHEENGTTGTAAGNPVPVASVPAWGAATPQNASALLGRFALAGGTLLSNANAEYAARWMVYPNPARSELNIELEKADGARTATLLNALGQVVRRHAMPQATLSLPVRGLAPGVYLLRLDGGTGPLVQRVLVE